MQLGLGLGLHVEEQIMVRCGPLIWHAPPTCQRQQHVYCAYIDDLSDTLG